MVVLSTRRCVAAAGFISLLRPGDPAPFPLRMKSRRITCCRTDHFCNVDGIAKTLFCCHRKCPAEYGQSLSAVSGRKRYNTLDFAGQNRVPKADLPALLWNPPGYRQHHFRVSERNAFCRYSFSPRAAKTKKCYLQQRGKMRGRAA